MDTEAAFSLLLECPRGDTCSDILLGVWSADHSMRLAQVTQQPTYTTCCLGLCSRMQFAADVGNHALTALRSCALEVQAKCWTGKLRQAGYHLQVRGH